MIESFDREKIMQMVIERYKFDREKNKKNNDAECEKILVLCELKIKAQRILDYFEQRDSPLSWYVGKVPYSILADIVYDMTKKEYKDRKILSNLKYEGIRYDFSELIYNASSAENEEQPESVRRSIEEFKKNDDKLKKFIDPLSQTEILLEILYSKKTNDEILKKISVLNINMIYYPIIMGKRIANIFGLEYINIAYIEQYLKMSEIIVGETLYFLIKKYRFEDQVRNLELILKNVRKIKEDLIEEIKFYEGNTYQVLIVNQNGKKSSPITELFAVYLQHRSYVEEIRKIDEILELDIKENPEFFLAPSNFLYKKYEDYTSCKELLIDLKESEKRNSNDKNKLIKAKDFIRFWFEDDYDFNNNLVMLRIIYREIFMNKARLNNYNENHTALDIANRFIDNKKNESIREVKERERIFIEKKILRGKFREANMLNFYSVYNEIIREFQEVLLQTLYIPRDDLIYIKIRDIVEDILMLFNEIYSDKYLL